MYTSRLLIGIGLFLIAASFFIVALTFYPVFIEELRYTAHSMGQTKQSIKKQASDTVPVDPSFDIIIPKLGANARVIPNVNPYSAKEYQVALSKGVAHARGTVYPGQIGNIFLFSHSSVNFYEAMRYNSIFYLLPKLQSGDDVYLYYENVKYHYVVTGYKIVDPNNVSYLTAQTTEKTLTLMTCWPPGTNLKRYLIFGKIAPLTN